MTYKEKILQAFPKARFATVYSNKIDEIVQFPSVCPYDLGLIDECATGIQCDTCEECWEMEVDDDD
jgi:hypothetical protein